MNIDLTNSVIDVLVWPVLINYLLPVYYWRTMTASRWAIYWLDQRSILFGMTDGYCWYWWLVYSCRYLLYDEPDLARLWLFIYYYSTICLASIIVLTSSIVVCMIRVKLLWPIVLWIRGLLMTWLTDSIVILYSVVFWFQQPYWLLLLFIIVLYLLTVIPGEDSMMTPNDTGNADYSWRDIIDWPWWRRGDKPRYYYLFLIFWWYDCQNQWCGLLLLLLTDDGGYDKAPLTVWPSIDDVTWPDVCNILLTISSIQ